MTPVAGSHARSAWPVPGCALNPGVHPCRFAPFARRPWLALLLLSPSIALAAERTATQFDTVTVTATRSEQTLDEVPNTVSVMTEREIDQKNVKNIQDLVRYEPGVSVGGTGSRFGLSGFTIRGIGGNRVLTQVDGVSMPDTFSFGGFLSAQRDYVDPDTLKQVEIIRGPASSLYGSDAIGGAVSFLTKDAADYLDEGDDAYARLKTGYDGSDDSWLRSTTSPPARATSTAWCTSAAVPARHWIPRVAPAASARPARKPTRSTTPPTTCSPSSAGTTPRASACS